MKFDSSSSFFCLVSSFTLMCFAGCAIPTIAWSQTAIASVNVDFGAPQPVNSASGLLFGTTPSTQASRLAPIQPRLWRFAAFSDITTNPPGPYHSWSALASAFDAIVPGVTRNLLLGQAYGFPMTNWNGVNQPPWQDWTYYENHLTTLVRTLRDGGLTGVWEVWNEPDHPDFWNGTEAQFHELYRRAYTIVRAELGANVDVAGPSYSNYSRVKIEAFLEFCLANGCEVNALVFHALDSSPNGLAAASANMREARTVFMDNPRYAPLKIRRLLINELGGQVYTRQPAGTLAHHASFEAGGADAAARACWRNGANRSECYNGSLGGLLTETTLEPRSVWWAHKLYADGVATRVAATVSGSNVVALASRTSETEAPQILVGHLDYARTQSGEPATLRTQLVLQNVTALSQFAGASRVAARIESVPNSGEAALAAPAVVQSIGVDVIGGTARIALPLLDVGAVFKVTILPIASIPDAPPTVTIMTPAETATFAAHAPFITLGGSASDVDGVAEVRWSDDRGRSGIAEGTTTWSIPAYALDLAIGSSTVITVTARDVGGTESQDTITVTPTAPFTYLLAEGATGSFFDLDILIANPNPAIVEATLTFLKEGGSTVTHTVSMTGLSRTTVRVDAIAGMENAAATAIVTANSPIIVERTMRWADGASYGAHTEKAVDGAASTWYFAEGSQGFFSTYLLLANPNGAANTATIEYLREGTSPIVRTYPLPPQSRVTVDAGADSELVGYSFGMIVRFTQPGVAERAMYFGGDPLWKAGHESAGAVVPSNSWFLAEGATGPFFETFILLANPQPAAAEVTATYLIQGAPSIEKTYAVPASGRLTINIEQEDTALANAAVGTQIRSSQPIVVERAQYWPYSPDQWYEAHNSFGVMASGTDWGLAEGRVGGPQNYETYILLANPGTTAAEVRIRFLRAIGTPLSKTFTVGPQSRLNIPIGSGDLVPELANEEFGAVIRSNVPIVVERAMYSTVGGITWSAGTNATGTRMLPAR